MAKDFSQMEDSNQSANVTIHEQVSRLPSGLRRTVLTGGLASAFAPLFGSLQGCATNQASAGGFVSGSVSTSVRSPKLSFESIAVGLTDALVVPKGYVATVLAPWGEAVGIAGSMPSFKSDSSNSPGDQAVQMGMHHDGIHFYPFQDSNTRGLLSMNHEYVDDGLLHAGGMVPWTADKVRKAQAAHGISVIEVQLINNQWQMVRPSPYARRLTGYTPFAVQGPAAGNALMRTAADPAGRTVLGTLNNCASSKTPWGTYLSGEENFRFYFDGGDNLTADQKRWGMVKTSFYRWGEHDERFNATKHPNEFNRFGWVVEVDPNDPTSTPIKRTALGRAAHEGAWVGVTKDNRAVVYSGEDARFEYIYKFVSRDTIKPAGNGLTQAQANRTLLDTGTLYVARFDADGTGAWLPLVHGVGPLTVQAGFADQGAVLIRARQASDALGATKMDRPEWLTIDPFSGEVYCTLTNNSERGKPNQPGVDAANPRADNVMGSIIRWKESGDFDSSLFKWNHLVLAGDPANQRAAAQGNIKGDMFACPDGITFDKFGSLWIQTDMHASQMYKGELKGIGNNQMLVCDPATGQTKRFLTGPTNCEITGIAFTPDQTTAFVNIQHPGENALDRSDPADPNKFSKWPGGSWGGLPRSATVAIRRVDGGVVGT